MAITPEQIIETAEALVERGESATLAAVRRELGGGSYTRGLTIIGTKTYAKA